MGEARVGKSEWDGVRGVVGACRVEMNGVGMTGFVGVGSNGDDPGVSDLCWGGMGDMGAGRRDRVRFVGWAGIDRG